MDLAGHRLGECSAPRVNTTLLGEPPIESPSSVAEVLPPPADMIRVRENYQKCINFG